MTKSLERVVRSLATENEALSKAFPSLVQLMEARGLPVNLSGTLSLEAAFNSIFFVFIGFWNSSVGGTGGGG